MEILKFSAHIKPLIPIHITNIQHCVSEKTHDCSMTVATLQYVAHYMALVHINRRVQASGTYFLQVIGLETSTYKLSGQKNVHLQEGFFAVNR